MKTIFSFCKKYRYTLVRTFSDVPTQPRYLTFLMLNPSTADEQLNDPTINRCISFAKSLGFDGIFVMNLYSLRATNPNELWKSHDPVGPINDFCIENYANVMTDIVCAWGNNADKSRAAAVIKILKSTEAKLWCLGLNQTGHPKHPLYISGAQQLIPFDGEGL